MTSSTTSAGPVPARPVLEGLSSSQLLTHASEIEQLSRHVEVARLEVALEWAIAHPVVVETSSSVLEAPDQLGGVGTPQVAAFATDTLAVAMSVPSVAASHLVADVLDLSFRLPLLWDLTRALRIPASRARRVAAATRELSVEGAEWVDRQVVAVAGRVSTAQLDRIVAHAVAQFDPDALKDREARARDTWGVDLDHPTSGDYAGTSTLTARGDSLDLARFHDVVNAEADTLSALGDTDSLGQRQAKALGVIAAQQAALDLTGLLGGEQPDAEPSHCERVAVRARALTRSQAKVKLHLHASLPDLLTRDHDDLVGTADTLGPATLARIREWVGHARVTVVPVLHVAADDSWTVDRHDPPPRMAEMVRLRDETCVFPRCGRHARGCDLDHIDPYDTGPPDDAGPTTPANLAPLCRRHHRAKTSGAWSYQRLAPGTYLWTGPAGITTLVTPDDVTDL
ncbi:HNH endonuclease [Nocardioides seonyuensis]|uniref:HNH endonuclease n=1 Tax=Nocardioides seonyuensis TaxID=2518371 RepID=A0A4P7IIC3_9ACTN|nr:HNH endonuclease signature motif containing protein [Nocardioides seonyuensis]QBX55987.1 HNH endonuclease [Nocardioides seonyuensis]